jgi:integrase
LYTVKVNANLAPATVRVMHFVLHRALSQAVRWERVGRKVADGDRVDIPRLPRQEAASLSAEQVRQALDAAHGDRVEALFVLALMAGLRRGELLALRWDAVDLDRGVVDVRYTMQPVSGGAVLAEPESRTSRRRVPIGDVAVAALRRRRSAQGAERLRAGGDWHDDGFVVTTEVGKPIPPMTVTRGWAAPLARAGLPAMPFHASRHSAANLMVEAGLSPKVAAERLGHATAALTLDRYSHLTDALRHEAARAIDAVLTREAG